MQQIGRVVSQHDTGLQMCDAACSIAPGAIHILAADLGGYTRGGLYTKHRKISLSTGNKVVRNVL